MIDFTTLPGSKPKSDIAKGCYIATIESAVMKDPKAGAKSTKPYLNMRLSLSTPAGKKVGSIFDMIFETETELPRFKLRRFIEALELPITGGFELKDLPKIVIGKKLLVDIMPEKQQGEFTGRDVVDVSSADIYYSLAEASRKFEGVAIPMDGNTINAADAEDAGDY